MTDADTLGTLIRVSRNYRVKRRELCCPSCGGDVVLRDGRLWCGCGESFGELRELGVKR